ncbi:hypothetical protein AK812_SmicGene38491 [Symbiodinium microadriaticum]|uniref:Uncharacterized protein n=1 Tax=Symbiodinium microadriaticum TaxID=2951 RepID=A0A1Q9CDM7_SYMMI|nr:hypothetical protein AK812_SmicGene38491 [Symbiodinium microadriaticum]
MGSAPRNSPERGRCVQSRICRTLGSPPKVSYRNDLRQWKRSEDGHVGRGEPRLDKGGKGGKAKGGEIFRKSWQLKLHSDRLYRKEKWKLLKTLANAGYPEFPDHIPTCGGSISDINTGRLSVSSTRKLIEGLSSCQEPTAALASALMTSFLKTRKGLNGEDLLPKLGPVTAGYWYKFPFTAPNKLDISDDQVPFDAKWNMRAGKQTKQLIQSFESVKIVAVHLRIATKENLHVSEYLMEWAGALELPLSSAKQAFETWDLEIDCLHLRQSPVAVAASSAAASGSDVVMTVAEESTRDSRLDGQRGIDGHWQPVSATGTNRLAVDARGGPKWRRKTSSSRYQRSNSLIRKAQYPKGKGGRKGREGKTVQSEAVDLHAKRRRFAGYLSLDWLEPSGTGYCFRGIAKTSVDAVFKAWLSSWRTDATTSPKLSGGFFDFDDLEEKETEMDSVYCSSCARVNGVLDTVSSTCAVCMRPTSSPRAGRIDRGWTLVAWLLAAISAGDSLFVLMGWRAAVQGAVRGSRPRCRGDHKAVASWMQELCLHSDDIT